MYIPIIKALHIALIISLKQKSINGFLDQQLYIFLRFLNIPWKYHPKRFYSHICVEMPRHIQPYHHRVLPYTYIFKSLPNHWKKKSISLLCIPFITSWAFFRMFIGELCFVKSNFIVFILYFAFFFFLINSSIPQAAIKHLFFFVRNVLFSYP